MVKVKEDMTGWKMWEHGVPDSRLTVLEQSEDYVNNSGKHYARWLCECNCPEHNQIITFGTSLKNGKTKSCGCLSIEKLKERSIGNSYGSLNKKHNKYDLSGEYGVIWSTNTNEEIYFDLEDADAILNQTWWINAVGYPTTTVSNKFITMHSFLGYYYPDHHNKNKLDNRRKNLVSCTRQENQRNCNLSKNNTSGFTGVSFDRRRDQWVAQITIDYKNKCIGRFNKKEDAIKARLHAELKYFVDFAPQRCLFEEYGIADNLAVNET